MNGAVMNGTVVEVSEFCTCVMFDEPCPPHLQDMTFNHDSPASVPMGLRSVGTRVKATYRVTNSYGLWFVSEADNEPQPITKET